jgi:hypothetical protein
MENGLFEWFLHFSSKQCCCVWHIVKQHWQNFSEDWHWIKCPNGWLCCIEVWWNIMWQAMSREVACADVDLADRWHENVTHFTTHYSPQDICNMDRILPFYSGWHTLKTDQLGCILRNNKLRFKFNKCELLFMGLHFFNTNCVIN